jgi:predicted secreted protein
MSKSILLCVCLFFSLAAQAETEAYDRVDFQVEAAREIANDLLVANLSVEIQDKQPARVAQLLNTAINDALRKAAAFSKIKTSSGNQSTYPVYGKSNRVDAWRGRGEIHIESRDFKAAGELIMTLQNTMQLSGVQFIVAPDSRAQAENSLIGEAIAAFKARADAIRSAVGASAYQTVRFSINNGSQPQPRVMMMRSAAMADAAIPAPDFAAGESRLTVQINGTIELQ